MALTDKTEIPRRTMVLFFVIDTSGSMDGRKIGTVNTAIEEVIPANKDVLKEFTGTQVEAAAPDSDKEDW